MTAYPTALDQPLKKPFCAAYSRAAGEQLPGTVKSIDLWLLIEFRGRWEHDAIDVFEEPIKLRLHTLRSQFPKSRLALIKRPDRTDGPLSMFWAFSREHQPLLYRTEFCSYEDLRFEPPLIEHLTAQPFFGVCTHGTHDLCCAQLGNKLYSEMLTLSQHVWQISHIGGCRFAPNVVCLPHGLVYGRLESTEASQVITSYQQSSLFLPKLRGRSSYSRPAQVAEHFLRSTGNAVGLEELRLLSVAEPGPNRWLVTFESSATQIRFEVSLRGEAIPIRTFKSCAATETSPREALLLDDVRFI